MENNQLIFLLEEQIFFSFNGRINCLNKSNNQLLGHILLKDGEVVFSQYDKLVSMKAIYQMLYLSFENKVNFVLEPEIVNIKKPDSNISLDKLKKYWSNHFSKAIQSKNLRPPLNLKVKINPEFMEKGEDLSDLEFDLLCIISDFSKIADILAETGLFMDFEVTYALISLRQKKALMVIEKP